jgi:hypothetical protein
MFGEYELDSSGSGQRPVAGSCEHRIETSGSIKGGEFLDYLSDYQLLKEDSAPWKLLLSFSVLTSSDLKAEVDPTPKSRVYQIFFEKCTV